MGGVNTTLSLYDSMGPVLASVTNSMNMVISSARAVENASGKMFDTTSLDTAKRYIDEASSAIAGMEESIKNNESAQRKHNKEMKDGHDIAERLKTTIKRIAITYLGFQGIKMFVGTSDELALIQARLNNIKDSSMTLEQVQQEIYNSAQRSRGEYLMTADIVSKLGAQAKNSFGNTKELIQFSEQLNKMFSISGTDPEGVRSVMYNLTQAMAVGVLRGQDLNAVMTNTPRILEEVAKYLDTDISQIRKLAEEGKLSADVIKNALLQSAEEINEEFGKMPMTVHQAGIQIKNYFIKAMEPAYARLTAFVNSDNFKVFVENAMRYADMFANATIVVLDGIVTVMNWVAENWSIIEPILISAIAMYTTWSIVLKVAKFASDALNMSLLTSPITWVILIIGAVIAIIVKWIISVGGIQIAWLIFVNKLINSTNTAYTFLYKVGNSMMNGLDKMKLGFDRTWTGIRNSTAVWKSGMLLLIQDTVNGAIDRINGLIKSVNKIPLVSIETIGKVEFGTNSAIKTKAENDARNNALKMQELENNTNKAKREQKLRAIETEAKENERKRLKEIEKLKAEKSNKSLLEIPAMGSLSSIPDIAKDMAGTNDATKGIKNKLDKGIDFKNEDLTYLRELATSRAINKFSFDKIEVKAENSFGDVNNMGDLAGFTDVLTNGLTNAIFETAEGLGGA